MYKRQAESFYTQYVNTDPFSGKRLVEPYGEKLYVVQNPAAKPLSQQEMDDVYALSLIHISIWKRKPP